MAGGPDLPMSTAVHTVDIPPATAMTIEPASGVPRSPAASPRSGHDEVLEARAASPERGLQRHGDELGGMVEGRLEARLKDPASDACAKPSTAGSSRTGMLEPMLPADVAVVAVANIPRSLQVPALPTLPDSLPSPSAARAEWVQPLRSCPSAPAPVSGRPSHHGPSSRAGAADPPKGAQTAERDAPKLALEVAPGGASPASGSRAAVPESCAVASKPEELEQGLEEGELMLTTLFSPARRVAPGQSLEGLLEAPEQVEEPEEPQPLHSVSGSPAPCLTNDQPSPVPRRREEVDQQAPPPESTAVPTGDAEAAVAPSVHASPASDAADEGTISSGGPFDVPLAPEHPGLHAASTSWEEPPVAKAKPQLPMAGIFAARSARAEPLPAAAYQPVRKGLWGQSRIVKADDEKPTKDSTIEIETAVPSASTLAGNAELLRAERADFAEGAKPPPLVQSRPPLKPVLGRRRASTPPSDDADSQGSAMDGEASLAAGPPQPQPQRQVSKAALFLLGISDSAEQALSGGGKVLPAGAQPSEATPAVEPRGDVPADAPAASPQRAPTSPGASPHSGLPSHWEEVTARLSPSSHSACSHQGPAGGDQSTSSRPARRRPPALTCASPQTPQRSVEGSPISGRSWAASPKARKPEPAPSSLAPAPSPLRLPCIAESQARRDASGGDHRVFQGVKLPMLDGRRSKKGVPKLPPVGEQLPQQLAESASAPALGALHRHGRSEEKHKLKSIEEQKMQLASKFELLSMLNQCHNNVGNMSTEQLQDFLHSLHSHPGRSHQRARKPSLGSALGPRRRQLDSVRGGALLF